MVLSKQERRIIYEGLSWIPKSEWALLCDNDDQRDWWNGIEFQFRNVQRVLQAYFSGEPYSAPDLDKKQQKISRAWADYYLDLYNLLFEGWDFLQKIKELEFKSPGETLIAIMEADAAAFFSVCLPESGRMEWSSADSYKLYRLEKTEVEGRLLPKERQPLEKLRGKRSRRQKQFIKPFQKLRDTCLLACIAAATPGSAIHSKLQRLNESAKQLQQVSQSTLRPPHTPGFAWDRGKKLTADRKGGVYRENP